MTSEEARDKLLAAIGEYAGSRVRIERRQNARAEIDEIHELQDHADQCSRAVAVAILDFERECRLEGAQAEAARMLELRAESDKLADDSEQPKT